MSRIVIIGGSGHVGGYLVPRLVEAGHQVVNVTRGQKALYRNHAAWKSVENITLDRDAEEKAGTFGGKIADLKPDVVIDKICFTLDSAQQLVEALDGRVSHFLHTGTIWVHGHSLTVPSYEDDARNPVGNYGIQKSEIENYLLDRARRTGFPATVVRPGHIVGPGWRSLNPAGNFNSQVYDTIARGEELVLPNIGLETVHHVHADDVAQVFMRAIGNWGAATGEAFNAVSGAAITLRGFSEAMYAWYGKEPNLQFAAFTKWSESQSKVDAEATWGHISRSPNHSIEKARKLLGYSPRYSSLAAVQESVSWLIEHGQLTGRN